MIQYSFGKQHTSRRKKKVVKVTGVVAAAVLLVGFFTTVAANSSNEAYAATAGQGIKKQSNSGTSGAKLEDSRYLVSYSQAVDTVKKQFPDSKIKSVQKQKAVIVLDRAGNEARTIPDINSTVTTTPAYIFEMVKTDDKALYQMTVVVNGISGEIINPQQWLNNDGICGPHNHPPGMGVHWHVCEYIPWKWTPKK